MEKLTKFSRKNRTGKGKSHRLRKVPDLFESTPKALAIEEVYECIVEHLTI